MIYFRYIGDFSLFKCQNILFYMYMYLNLQKKTSKGNHGTPLI